MEGIETNYPHWSRNYFQSTPTKHRSVNLWWQHVPNRHVRSDTLCSVMLTSTKTTEKQVYSYSAINITLCVLSKSQGCHLQLFFRVFRNEDVPLRELKRDLNKYKTIYSWKEIHYLKEKKYTQLIYEHNFNCYILFLIAKNS